MTRQDKTETLYMYTCLGIPVTSRNKSKDVIVNHINASGNEIYDWLRQSVNTEHKGGSAYGRGKNCGYFLQEKYAGKVDKQMIADYYNTEFCINGA